MHEVVSVRMPRGQEGHKGLLARWDFTGMGDIFPGDDVIAQRIYQNIKKSLRRWTYNL